MPPHCAFVSGCITAVGSRACPTYLYRIFLYCSHSPRSASTGSLCESNHRNCTGRDGHLYHSLAPRTVSHHVHRLFGAFVGRGGRTASSCLRVHSKKRYRPDIPLIYYAAAPWLHTRRIGVTATYPPYPRARAPDRAHPAARADPIARSAPAPPHRHLPERASFSRMSESVPRSRYRPRRPRDTPLRLPSGAAARHLDRKVCPAKFIRGHARTGSRSSIPTQTAPGERSSGGR